MNTRKHFEYIRNLSRFMRIEMLIFLLLTTSITEGQMFISNDLYNTYDQYKIDKLVNKRFNYDEMQQYIDELMRSSKIRKRIIGRSLENREINIYSIGNGPVDVLGWSQMHGDESTATMALIDLLNFLVADDNFNDFRTKLFNELTIHFIPMLNPDGTERFQRRNALDIDINRDALRLAYPESKALKAAQDSLKPVFGFNLHDQDLRYTVGKTYKSATLSFLAPAFNKEKDINEIRGNAMKVIVNMYNELFKFIPGHIARYDDEFEPRAFGDNFAKWGTGTILIESGGWKNNFEKQFLRKLNFIGILIAFQSIAEKAYEHADIKLYNLIPENRKYLFDLLVKNIKRKYNNEYYLLDLGINHRELSINNGRDDYYVGIVDDIGDLSTFFGYDEVDCSGLIIEEGKVFPEEFNSIDDLKNYDIVSLYKEGYTSVTVKNLDEEIKYTQLPINICMPGSEYKSEIKLGGFADYVIKDNKQIKYVIINGFFYDLTSGKNTIINGNIIK